MISTAPHAARWRRGAHHRRAEARSRQVESENVVHEVDVGVVASEKTLADADGRVQPRNVGLALAVDGIPLAERWRVGSERLNAAPDLSLRVGLDGGLCQIALLEQAEVCRATRLCISRDLSVHSRHQSQAPASRVGCANSESLHLRLLRSLSVVHASCVLVRHLELQRSPCCKQLNHKVRGHDDIETQRV
jgi:hypothetical protein